MISEKLLTEIRAYHTLKKYGTKESKLHRDIQSDIREYWEGNDYKHGINDYELANICKEWLRDQRLIFSIIWTEKCNITTNIDTGESVMDIDASYEQCIDFTNGDNLIDGYMIKDAIGYLSDNPKSSFDINYESGKLSGQRYYEVMKVESHDNKKGEYTLKQMVFKPEIIEKTFEDVSENVALFNMCQWYYEL